MRFWDSSAIVSLVIEERRSSACRRLLRSDKAMAVWALSRTEVLSAVWRHARAGDLDRAGALEASRRLETLAKAWVEIDGLDAVRARAERLLAVHSLRAADALQLGAAILLSRDRPRWPLVTADEELAAAAQLEGFEVIVPAS